MSAIKPVRFLSKEVKFPRTFYHYKKGGHVAALQNHLRHSFFFKIDFRAFFYSISRNRVAASLHDVGFSKARIYAKWSCVPNPLLEPRYSLPIGFVQSPALASLVLMHSPILTALTKAERNNVQSSIYLDDIICSSDNIDALHSAYVDLHEACKKANLFPNPLKVAEPCEEITAFNCILRNGFTTVSTERIIKFHDKPRSPQSIGAFDQYCVAVSAMNYILHPIFAPKE